MTFSAMPDMIDEPLQAIPQTPLLVLLFTNVSLVIFGTSMDCPPASLILVQFRPLVAREIATARRQRRAGIGAGRLRETLAHVLERRGAMPALDPVV